MQNHTICLAWYDEDLQTQPKAKLWGENIPFFKSPSNCSIKKKFKNYLVSLTLQPYNKRQTALVHSVVKCCILNYLDFINSLLSTIRNLKTHIKLKGQILKRVETGWQVNPRKYAKVYHSRASPKAASRGQRFPWQFWPPWWQTADRAEEYYWAVCKNVSAISTGELLPAYR